MQRIRHFLNTDKNDNIEITGGGPTAKRPIEMSGVSQVQPCVAQLTGMKQVWMSADTACVDRQVDITRDVESSEK